MIKVKTKRLRMVQFNYKDKKEMTQSGDTDEYREAARGSSYDLLRQAVEGPFRYPIYTYWKILLNSDDAYIGCIRVQTMPIHGSTEIVFEIDDPYRGMGYATEAILEILKSKFYRKNLYFITAEVEKKNAAALRVLEKCGFTIESETERVLFLAKERDEPKLKPSLLLAFFILLCAVIIGIAGGGALHVILLSLLLIILYPIVLFSNDRRKRKKYRSFLSGYGKRNDYNELA